MKPKSGTAVVIAVFCVLSPLGRSVGATFSFTNSSSIVLNTGPSPPSLPVPGSLYPSSITVSNLPGLVLGKVAVTLNGFTHSFPSDLYVLLVGPEGQEGLVLAEVGGQTKYSVTNLTIRLDDDAASFLPVFTSLTSGTFKPTNGYLSLGGYTNLVKDFPPPAPSGSSNAIPALSMFKNTNPNGTWNLFVVDDGAGDTGSVNGGWTLDITAGVPLNYYKTPTNVVVSWTNAVTGCVLQSVPNLSTTWSNVTATTVMSGGHFWVTNPITGAGTFFRLVK